MAGTSGNNGKTIIARGKAEYRGVNIMETANGCTIVLGKNEYPCKDLNEAVALIDAAYSRVLMDPRMACENEIGPSRAND